MKKVFVIAPIAAGLTVCVCTAALAALQKEPKATVYRGEEWHFDIEEKEYPYITVPPKEQKEPPSYENGFAGKVEPQEKQQEKKYDIILLGR